MSRGGGTIVGESTALLPSGLHTDQVQPIGHSDDDNRQHRRLRGRTKYLQVYRSCLKVDDAADSNSEFGRWLQLLRCES